MERVQFTIDPTQPGCVQVLTHAVKDGGLPLDGRLNFSWTSGWTSG